MKISFNLLHFVKFFHFVFFFRFGLLFYKRSCYNESNEEKEILMEAWKNYFNVMNEIIAKVMDSQGENIMKAATLVRRRVAAGRSDLWIGRGPFPFGH